MKKFYNLGPDIHYSTPDFQSQVKYMYLISILEACTILAEKTTHDYILNKRLMSLLYTCGMQSDQDFQKLLQIPDSTVSLSLLDFNSNMGKKRD